MPSTPSVPKRSAPLVIYIRTQCARRLLETTQDKLGVTAGRPGFTEGMIFSRAFKRWIGITPSDYLRLH
jgi:AraC-like DNA-binding protein